MKTIWFTSDLHFGHANVIKYANRPFKDVDEMNATMVKNWNDRVRPADDVYIVGDFSLCKPSRAISFVKELKGHKYLVRGNHDKWIKDSDAAIFEWVKDMYTVKIEDKDAVGGVQRIVLCHYGLRVWDMRHHGAWHLYGHSHGTLPDDGFGKCFDVGVDCQDFKPISYDEVKEKMALRISEPVDHHGREERDDG